MQESFAEVGVDALSIS